MAALAAAVSGCAGSPISAGSPAAPAAVVSSSLSPADAAVVAAKKADAARQAAAPSDTPTPVELETGIIEDNEAPASGSTFLGVDRWVGKVDGGYIVVYAGSAGVEAVTGKDSADGRLLVQRLGPAGGVAQAWWIDVPKAGALRVTSFEGTMLVISDAHGGTHVFDAASHAWSS